MSKELTTTKEQPYTQDQIELIKTTVAKGATNDELKLFVVTAHRLGLDPFAKQIHFVKRKVKQNGQYVEVGTFQVSIDGYRSIAERTGNYAGNDDPIFDNETTPRKASVTVYKIIHGVRCPFTATARWDQYYPGDTQGFMWKKMPHLMLGKCAEALALRKAFPNELSGVYTHEEMQQADNSQPATARVVDAKPLVEAPTDPLVTPLIKPISDAQKNAIDKMMTEKGYSEADLMDEGFSALADLTGGQGGTGSELIGWLITAKPKEINGTAQISKEEADAIVEEESK